MENVIVIAIVIALIGGAVWYIRKEKRRGIHCVGCPDSAVCSGNCAGCSGNCSAHAETRSK